MSEPFESRESNDPTVDQLEADFQRWSRCVRIARICRRAFPLSGGIITIAMILRLFGIMAGDQVSDASASFSFAASGIRFGISVWVFGWLLSIAVIAFSKGRIKDLVEKGAPQSSRWRA